MRAGLDLFLAPILLLLSFASSLYAVEKKSAEEARPLVIEWLANSRDFKTLQIDFAQERQLRALRRPLSRQGKLWITHSGQIRWQIDDPASLLLVRNGSDAPLLWLDLKKQTWQALDPESDTTQGNAQAMQFLMQSQTSTIEAFEAAFTIRGARSIDDQPGHWRLELDLKDRRAGIVVKDVFFQIEPATGALHLMEFQLRDGSLLRTRVTHALKNPKIDPALFKPDLTGLSPAGAAK